MNTYLAWVRGTQTKGTYHTFQVRDDLAGQGVAVYAPTELQIYRVGKKRKWQSKEVPALGGYIFAECRPEDFPALIGHKLVLPTVQNLSRHDVIELSAYRTRLEAEYARAERATASRKTMCAYKRGDEVELMGKALNDTVLRFQGLIEGDDIPILDLEVEMMGQVVRVRADPLDVRLVK